MVRPTNVTVTYMATGSYKTKHNTLLDALCQAKKHFCLQNVLHDLISLLLLVFTLVVESSGETCNAVKNKLNDVRDLKDEFPKFIGLLRTVLQNSTKTDVGRKPSYMSPVLKFTKVCYSDILLNQLSLD
jgi:hypothetical protein